MEEQNQSQPVQNSSSSMGKTVAVIALVVVAALGTLMFVNNTQNKNTITNTVQTIPTQATSKVEPTSVVVVKDVKDGEYSAVGKYKSPGGDEELGVFVTVKDGVITDSKVEVKATRPISVTRQKDFAENYKSLVVGKKISEVNLGKVSGSSLTPIGFNEALKTIQAQAES